MGYDPNNKIENRTVRHGMEEAANSMLDDEGDTEMQDMALKVEGML